MDHMLNDVILCLFLQLTECTAYSLSNNVIKYSREWCVRNVSVWNENHDILTDIAQCIMGVVVTGIE